MSKSTSTILQATNADAHAVKKCAELAYTHYVDRMGKEPAPMRVNFKDAVTKGRITVAKINRELVGFAIHYTQDDREQLENIAVLPTFQGKGVGKQILANVEQQCLKKGIKRIQLYTNELMHENIAMYKHLGYAETHRKIQDGFARVFFSKALNE